MGIRQKILHTIGHHARIAPDTMPHQVYWSISVQGEALGPVGLPSLVHMFHTPLHRNRGGKEYRRSDGNERLDEDVSRSAG